MVLGRWAMTGPADSVEATVIDGRPSRQHVGAVYGPSMPTGTAPSPRWESVASGWRAQSPVPWEASTRRRRGRSGGRRPLPRNLSGLLV